MNKILIKIQQFWQFLRKELIKEKEQFNMASYEYPIQVPKITHFR
jgi:hypothetical protein